MGDAQKCRWCEQGTYEQLADPKKPNQAENLGYRNVNADYGWRILRCASCGHFQLFRERVAT